MIEIRTWEEAANTAHALMPENSGGVEAHWIQRQAERLLQAALWYVATEQDGRVSLEGVLAIVTEEIVPHEQLTVLDTHADRRIGTAIAAVRANMLPYKLDQPKNAAAILAEQVLRTHLT